MIGGVNERVPHISLNKLKSTSLGLFLTEREFQSFFLVWLECMTNVYLIKKNTYTVMFR